MFLCLKIDQIYIITSSFPDQSLNMFKTCNFYAMPKNADIEKNLHVIEIFL